MAYDLSGILTGGAASRADSISGLDPRFAAVIQQMMAAAPPEVASQLRIMSAYRSPETQQRLWNDALKKYGSPDAARRWVAPPGRSQHGQGRAIDWSHLNKGARDWVRSNAAQFGGVFPLAHEPWHMELAGARSMNMGAPSTAQGVTLNSGPQPGLSAPMVPSGTPASPTAPAGGGFAGALSGILQGLSGGGRSSASSSADTDITPSSIGQEVGAGAGTQAAAQLMAALMAGRRSRYGMSLTGMM